MYSSMYPPLSGKIQVNSQKLPNYPFNGTYYGGITTTLAPLPEPVGPSAIGPSRTIPSRPA
ncbi:MAG: hypothetical protein IPH53_11870 [Flavobacteriales bacterium]|nr:hypothetical protein [Flavobacteriales bacterium]